MFLGLNCKKPSLIIALLKRCFTLLYLYFFDRCLYILVDIFLKASNVKTRTTETEVYVVSAQKNLVEERMKICKELWDADIKVLNW